MSATRERRKLPPMLHRTYSTVCHQGPSEGATRKRRFSTYKRASLSPIRHGYSLCPNDVGDSRACGVYDGCAGYNEQRLTRLIKEGDRVVAGNSVVFPFWALCTYGSNNVTVIGVFGHVVGAPPPSHNAIIASQPGLLSLLPRHFSCFIYTSSNC